jgi:hypothetical protein
MPTNSQEFEDDEQISKDDNNSHDLEDSKSVVKSDTKKN